MQVCAQLALHFQLATDRDKRADNKESGLIQIKSETGRLM